jgi:hypothetical protein
MPQIVMPEDAGELSRLSTLFRIYFWARIELCFWFPFPFCLADRSVAPTDMQTALYPDPRERAYVAATRALRLKLM